MDLADLTPLATLVVASVALFVGLRTIRQRDRADRRDQWWKRAQWVIDLTLSEDSHRRDLGYNAMLLLFDSSLAGPEELELLEVALSAELLRRTDVLDDGWDISDDGEQDAERSEEDS